MVVKEEKEIGRDCAEVLVWEYGRWGLPSYQRDHKGAEVWESRG